MKQYLTKWSTYLNHQKHPPMKHFISNAYRSTNKQFLHGSLHSLPMLTPTMTNLSTLVQTQVAMTTLLWRQLHQFGANMSHSWTMKPPTTPYLRPTLENPSQNLSSLDKTWATQQPPLGHTEPLIIPMWVPQETLRPHIWHITNFISKRKWQISTTSLLNFEQHKQTNHNLEAQFPQNHPASPTQGQTRKSSSVSYSDGSPTKPNIE